MIEIIVQIYPLKMGFQTNWLFKKMDFSHQGETNQYNFLLFFANRFK